MAKFHEKAVVIYGVTQNAEGSSAVKSLADLAGETLSVTSGATAVTGGTKFQYGVAPGDGLGSLTVGGYIYDNSGAVVGQVASIDSQTAATLSDNALVTVSAATFSTGLGAKNALAALNLNYSTELTSEAHVYVGDELSRDEETVITDKYAVFDFEVFLPKRGTIAGADPVAAEVPMPDWFESCGLATIISTGSGGYIDITNGTSVNDYMTIEVRRSSPDIATEKCFEMANCRGTIDFDSTVGTRAKLKFNYNGNLTQVVQKTAIVADFQNQKSGHAGSINSTTVTLSNLALWVGDTAPTSPAVDATNFCFDKLLVPNVDGFEYDRYQTSCEDGWSKGATPYDVTATIIEDAADATYNPDNHLEETHQLLLNYGSVAGNIVELTWYKLMLGGVTASTVAKYSGQDLAFRCIGNFNIRLK